MKTKIFTNIKEEPHGQSLVELAISLMIILLLLLGAVEFSLALFQYVTIRDAAQEGAIYGSINPTEESGIQWRAKAAASDVLPQLPKNDVAVTINEDENHVGKTISQAIAANEACEGTTSGSPNSLTVTITFAHPITFPLVGPVIGSNTINLTARVTNTILQPTCP
ncbi:MAG: TadE/TadG family type IV pilus assembly protein [Anaerolineales bacterium]|nr:TadE/TadG family type IV pilus assembly protein [Anaerolineales bacterium]